MVNLRSNQGKGRKKWHRRKKAGIVRRRWIWVSGGKTGWSTDPRKKNTHGREWCDKQRRGAKYHTISRPGTRVLLCALIPLWIIEDVVWRIQMSPGFDRVGGTGQRTWINKDNYAWLGNIWRARGKKTPPGGIIIGKPVSLPGNPRTLTHTHTGKHAGLYLRV